MAKKPSRIKNLSRLNRTFLILTPVLVLVSIISWGLNSGLFVSTEIDIQSIDKSEQNAHFNALKQIILEDLRPLKKKPVWKVSLNDLLESMYQKEWVKEARVSRRFPNQIMISLRMENVKLIALDPKGKVKAISSSGEYLPNLAGGIVPDVPILRGNRLLRSRELRSIAVELVSQLPRSGLLSPGTVSEIFYDKKNGFELLLNKSALQIIMGNELFDIKAKRVNRVLEYMDAKQVQGRVIDTRFAKKILVRLRKGS